MAIKNFTVQDAMTMYGVKEWGYGFFGGEQQGPPGSASHPGREPQLRRLRDRPAPAQEGRRHAADPALPPDPLGAGHGTERGLPQGHAGIRVRGRLPGRLPGEVQPDQGSRRPGGEIRLQVPLRAGSRLQARAHDRPVHEPASGRLRHLQRVQGRDLHPDGAAGPQGRPQRAHHRREDDRAGPDPQGGQGPQGGAPPGPALQAQRPGQRQVGEFRRGPRQVRPQHPGAAGGGGDPGDARACWIPSRSCTSTSAARSPTSAG